MPLWFHAPGVPTVAGHVAQPSSPPHGPRPPPPYSGGHGVQAVPLPFSCGEAPAHHEARPVKGPEGSGALHALADAFSSGASRTQNSLQHVAPRSSHRHGSSGRSFIAPLQLKHSHECSILSSTCRWQPAGHSHIILLRWRGPETDLPGSMGGAGKTKPRAFLSCGNSSRDAARLGG